MVKGLYRTIVYMDGFIFYYGEMRGTPYKWLNRFLVIGRISKMYWSAVITYRNESVRMISVRCSQKKEIELYEN